MDALESCLNVGLLYLSKDVAGQEPKNSFIVEPSLGRVFAEQNAEVVNWQATVEIWKDVKTVLRTLK